VGLSRELHRRGIYPPIDVIPSLSRLMGAGIGDGRTRADHRELTDQLYAMYAKGREALTMAAIVGTSGLTEVDRRAADFTSAFERDFVAQRGRRTIEQTLDLGWRLLRAFPRDELLRVSDATFASRAEQGGATRV